MSIREGAAHTSISKSSHQIAMTQLNFKPYHPTLIDRIFWSDEAKFSMNTTVNRYNSPTGLEKIRISNLRYQIQNKGLQCGVE